MITRRQLAGVRKALGKLDTDAQEAAARVIERVGVEDRERLRDALSTALRPICEQSFSMAADLAASVYNGWRLADIGSTFDGVPKRSTFGEGKFEAMLNTAMQPGASIESVINGFIGYNNRASYTNTLVMAGYSDPVKPRYARVPDGAEACEFCMMLASRGFEYRKGSDGEHVHNHANCQCVYVASWSTRPEAEGYYPDYWYDRWEDSMWERSENTQEYKEIKKRYSESGKYRSGWASDRFSSFEDVKQYIYGAKDMQELEHRYSELGGIYGFDKMRTGGIRNAVRHVSKRL